MKSSEENASRYRNTFIENCDSENSPKASAHNFRKLATQIEKNVVEGGWDALAGVELMRDKVKAANALVDDENGINNYADECLANLSKFKNQSKDWKCSITLDDPIFEAFLSSNDKASQESKQISDFYLKQCMKKEVKPDLVKVTKSSPKGGLPLPSRIITKVTTAPTLEPSTRQVKAEESNFDLIPDEIPSFTSMNSVRPAFIRGRNSPNYCPPQPTPRPNPPPTKFLNNLGGYNRMTRPIYPTPSPPFSNDNETAPPPPPSAFKTAHQQMVINNQARGRSGGGGGARGSGGGVQNSGCYGSRGGYNQPGDGTVTPSSYGVGRKNLGTRPGPAVTVVKMQPEGCLLNRFTPASGFKPPVRTPDDQGSYGGGQGGNGSGYQSYCTYIVLISVILYLLYLYGAAGGDERYKNIDPKMIELITNEIMDQGAPITWEDIAGLEFAKTTVQEIVVWPMLRPDIFTGLRGPPKGLLLFGPPGTGKTLIGKCIASQSGSTFFSISAASLTSKWVGEGEKMVRALFAVAKVNQPSVVFIDEIDSLLSSRSDNEHESSRRIKTEFLVQLDGAGPEGGERVLVVGATNRPQQLDEAARRRLVKRLYIPLPEAEARKKIIYNLLAKERHEVSEAEVEEVGRQTEGYSGADMANLCKEAALGPIRSLPFGQIQSVRPDQVRDINYKDLQNALRQVKASVSEQDLDLYLDWDKKFGAGK